MGHDGHAGRSDTLNFRQHSIYMHWYLFFSHLSHAFVLESVRTHTGRAATRPQEKRTYSNDAPNEE
jgi:hypothetical protein